MGSTFFTLEIARRGLQAAQKALEVTGHNVANASVKGYSRQEAVLAATKPYASPNSELGTEAFQLGSGVEVKEIRRISDEYLDKQIRFNQSEAGYWQEKQSALLEVEATLGEPGDFGLRKLFSDFWARWGDFQQNPENEGVKTTLIEASDALAGGFRLVHKGFTSINEGLEQRLSGNNTGLIEEVNGLTRRLAELNESISKVKSLGGQPNDLLDEQNRLLEKLSELIDLKVSGEPDGSVTVYAGDPKDTILVAGSSYQKLQYDTQNNKFLIEGHEIEISKGKIGGLLAARHDIDRYIERLSSLAEQLVGQVNNIHGSPVFQQSLGAADISLDENFNTNSLNPASALDVIRLREQKLDFEEINATLEGFYQGQLVADIGANLQIANQNQEGREAIGNQLEVLRQSVSGVSLDEEMSKLIQYQYAYQASARVLSMVDEFLDILINSLR